jgi:hypothetical protein
MDMPQLIVTAVLVESAPRARSPVTTASPASGSSPCSSAIWPKVRPDYSTLAAAAAESDPDLRRARGRDRRPPLDPERPPADDELDATLAGATVARGAVLNTAAGAAAALRAGVTTVVALPSQPELVLLMRFFTTACSDD